DPAMVNVYYATSLHLYFFFYICNIVVFMALYIISSYIHSQLLFKTINMKNTQWIAVTLLFLTFFASCKKDEDAEPILPSATLSNIEIGSGNNELGIAGQDFHFNVEI